MTRQLRLPDAIIIGAQRSGTTSLYNWLMGQPGVWDSKEPKREIGYYCFDHNFSQGREWYAANFATAPRDQAIIEKSPVYLDHPLTPVRIKRSGHQAKFIVLLRNPVDRAYSHYWKAKAKCFDSSPTFEEALENSAYLIEEQGDSGSYYLSARHVLSYIERGMYSRHLWAWFGRFPRDRFLILRSEDVFAHPKDAIKEACAFIGVAYSPPKKLRRFQRLQYPPMAPDTRQMLELEFAPHNAALAALLDDDKWKWEDLKK